MIQVAKITAELAAQIAGTLSIDGIRLFNPIQDINGNWVMDINMAIQNGLPYKIINFIPIPYEEGL